MRAKQLEFDFTPRRPLSDYVNVNVTREAPDEADIDRFIDLMQREVMETLYGTIPSIRIQGTFTVDE